MQTTLSAQYDEAKQPGAMGERMDWSLCIVTGNGVRLRVDEEFDDVDEALAHGLGLADHLGKCLASKLLKPKAVLLCADDEPMAPIEVIEGGIYPHDDGGGRYLWLCGSPASSSRRN